MIGFKLIGELEQKTKIRFRNTDDFEKKIEAIKKSGYESDDVTFTVWCIN